MFIPRTLAQVEGPIRAAWMRAVIVGLFLTLALFSILSVSLGSAQVSLSVGDVAQSDIQAGETVTFVSESQTEAEREAAAAAVETQYAPIAPLPDIRQGQLRAYDTTVSLISTVLQRRDDGELSLSEVPATLEGRESELNPAQEEQLAVMSIATWNLVAVAGREVLQAALSDPVYDDRLAEVQREVRANITNDLAPAERQLAGDLAAAKVRPNMEASPELTEAARQVARDQVKPVYVTIRKDETVVRRGDTLTALDLEKLEQLGLTGPRLEGETLLANALLALIISALLVAFLWSTEPTIWFRNRSLLLFLLALVGSAIAIRITADRALWAYVVPTTATVLLTTLLLDGAVGAAMAVTLAVLAGLMNREAFGPTLYTLAGGVISILAIIHAERLNAFVRAGVLLALANVSVLTAVTLLEQGTWATILQGLVAGSVNAGLAVVLAVGSFAVIGNLFGIMTVFQLLELANPSSRLLRRLLLETPGTYHHSVMVGNLAERAAETIGADPLLARVAAYYHDIGKMKNPLAFIENQAGAQNIHDELSPEVSARIIAGHIRDGIDLGYEYGLPTQIIAFIPQHHGTSVMSYFYGKALQEAGGNVEAVDEDIYRYPGPRPQSREAAILMLADGVEASVRSLDDKDEASIRAMVDRIVDARLDDGQLDDAELTMKAIGQIKDAFVGQLLGMYHSRIKYPDNVVPLEPARREQA
jgi:cyclic-di-AMP phosphodiesterase PgpH